MRRAALEKARTRRTWRNHLFFTHRNEIAANGKTECICDQQINRFRKGQRQLGCGRPRCMLCHSEKIFQKPTLALLKSNDSMQDGIKELEYE